MQIEVGKVYKNITTFDANDISQIRIRTIREINYLRNKLLNYSDFSKVVDALNDALKLL
jgi:hypothetical protein